MLYLRIKSKFFVWFTVKYGHKWHQYVAKMALNATMGGLWGNFTTIFLIVEYLQSQFTFEMKYQNTTCLDVDCIFNLSPCI